MLSNISDSYKNELILSEDDIHVSYLHPYPPTPATTIVESKNNEESCIFKLPIHQYKQLLFQAKSVAQMLCKKLPVNRCAMLTQPTNCPPQIKVIPLHGIDSQWTEIVSSQPEYNNQYPGYCTSKNGPRASDDTLNSIQNQIRSKLQNTEISTQYFGDLNDNNLFSRIVRGEEKQWRIWEDCQHIAFLTPFPNTPGFTVVVPRKHLCSDIFSLQNEDFEKLIEAAYEVSSLIKTSLSVQSTCMIFEGFEIDYAHIKLIPIITSNCCQHSYKQMPTVFHSKYEGYVTSLKGPLFPQQQMRQILCRLKDAKLN